jgi:type IV secretion system protein VirB6
MDSQAALAMLDGLLGLLGSTGFDRFMQAANPVTDLGNLFFFYEIKEFVNYRIDRFMEGLLGRTMSLAGAVALSLMTVWILFKGFRILSGKSQESMMALVMDSLRAALIVAAATTMAAGGSSIVKVMSDDMMNAIYHTVTGHPTDNPYTAIDKSLGYMQLAMLSIDALQVSGDETIAAAKSRAQLFTGVGIAGPALVGGTLLMLNRIAMALFVGLGPIFILCLLFDATKALFNKWLLFGIGTMFSLGVLSVMVSLSLDVVLAVAASFWVGSFLGTNTEGISSMALQQGGLGLVMTMLIVTVPPMAASFFQGTLGQISTVNMFGGGGAATQTRQTTVPQAPIHAGNPVPQAPRNAETEAARGSNAPPNASQGMNNPMLGPRPSGSDAARKDVVKGSDSSEHGSAQPQSQSQSAPLLGRNSPIAADSGRQSGQNQSADRTGDG